MLGALGILLNKNAKNLQSGFKPLLLAQVDKAAKLFVLWIVIETGMSGRENGPLFLIEENESQESYCSLGKERKGKDTS